MGRVDLLLVAGVLLYCFINNAEGCTSSSDCVFFPKCCKYSNSLNTCNFVCACGADTCSSSSTCCGTAFSGHCSRWSLGCTVSSAINSVFHLGIGAIVGIAIGGFFFLVLCISLIALCCAKCAHRGNVNRGTQLQTARTAYVTPSSGQQQNTVTMGYPNPSYNAPATVYQNVAPPVPPTWYPQPNNQYPDNNRYSQPVPLPYNEQPLANYQAKGEFQPDPAVPLPPYKE
uniref:proline-rich receptor-like protein kinase PERK2 isoform X2 n=1 Tax=Ciona intestinalis TaxID=7719 RepID=UPI00089DBB94|nr:proline-rich receptor-like protein kinase PERK2 isoform X2 [Ciona intestinalis]|eukprot:XP_018666758.1 proline-rich receptor-like protein kinase PERK2 isoform X2 [Ciona intestinalis]